MTGESWSEEEHKNFLLGLNKLGKGDWRGISRNYVVSRTPTQVASHAQKYFIRQTNANRRKRRSSLFDMVIEDVSISSPLFMISACNVVMQPGPASKHVRMHSNVYACLRVVLTLSLFPVALVSSCISVDIESPCNMKSV